VPEQHRAKAKEAPSVRATPETIRRDAERRRQEQTEAAQSARQREINEARAASEAEFNRVAAGCASIANVDIALKPGSRVTIFGGAKERFAFDKCMAGSGQPTTGAR
jgi:hypothetical protein